jgi:hypothetical protein
VSVGLAELRELLADPEMRAMAEKLIERHPRRHALMAAVLAELREKEAANGDQ